MGAGALLGDRPGVELLSGAALAGDEDVGEGPGDLADHVVDAEHPGAVSQDEAEVEVFPEVVPHGLLLPVEGPHLEGPGDRLAQLGVVEGFGQVVVGAVVHGLDRGLGRGVGRDHDDHRARVPGLGGPEHVDARHVPEADVAEQEVEVPFLYHGDRLFAAPGDGDPVPLPLQHQLEKLPHAELVVNDQYPISHPHLAPPGNCLLPSSPPQPPNHLTT